MRWLKDRRVTSHSKSLVHIISENRERAEEAEEREEITRTVNDMLRNYIEE